MKRPVVDGSSDCKHGVYTKTQPGRLLATRRKLKEWTCVQCGRTKPEIDKEKNRG